MEPIEHTVGVVAYSTGISVRTLHHYNSELSDEDHLRRQHALLSEQIGRQRAMIGPIDKELDARKAGIVLTPAERFEVFGGDRLVEMADEAERRWGDLPEFTQRRERTSCYTKQDWAARDPLPDDPEAIIVAEPSTTGPEETALSTTVTDEQIQALAATAKPYSLAVLRWGPTRNTERANAIELEHQRRMVSLRADGVIAVLCPVASDTIAGVAIMTVPAEEATAILAEDPCVQAEMMHYEVHPCQGFPGDTLPG